MIIKVRYKIIKIIKKLKEFDIRNYSKILKKIRDLMEKITQRFLNLIEIPEI